jgi:hypothetical protein
MKPSTKILFAGALLPLSLFAASPQPPNIVFILADDHGPQAISCYGSKVIQTPNIDRLAKGGMRFWLTPQRNTKAAGWIGIFNRSTSARTLPVSPAALGLPAAPFKLQNVWMSSELRISADTSAAVEIPPQDVCFFRFESI